MFGNAIGIVKGTKHRPMAEAFVNFVLSKEVQSNFMSAVMLAPTNTGAVLTEAAKPYVADPGAAEVIDWSVVAKDMPAWLDRWNRTMTYPNAEGQPLSSDCFATVTVKDAGNGKSLVEWKARFKRA